MRTTMTRSATTAAILACAASVGLFACRRAGPQDSSSSTTSTRASSEARPRPIQDAGPIDVRSANAKAHRGGGGTGAVGYSEIVPLRTWIEAAHRQSLLLSYPPSTVELIDSKPDPVTGEWLEASYIAVAPFKVGKVATSQKDTLVLAGRSARDETEFVLERWELVTSPQQQPASGGGTPPLFPAKHFRPTEIFRGTLSGEVLGLEFDHEQRFMYVLLGDESTAKLLKFDNEANAAPETVATSSTYPELVGMHHIQKFDHLSMGRQLECARLFPDGLTLLFVDTNNDGTFDGAPIIGSFEALKDMGLSGSEVRDPLRGPNY